MKKLTRTGWGMNLKTLVRYESLEKDFKSNEYRILKTNSGLAVGLGRSYGDSSFNSEGMTWTTEKLLDLEIIPEQKMAICGSGVTIGELERAASRHGLFPYVVPGTEFVTIGGAIASNVHGKSHHTDGSFGDYVIEMSVINNNGGISILSPTGKDSEKFWATIGGMGLTGAIVKAKILLKPIETNYMTVEEKRVSNLKEMLNVLNSFDSEYSHTVAWIDLSGSYTGRGVVGGANHAKLNELGEKQKQKPHREKCPGKVSLPKNLPIRLIYSWNIRLFNLLWYYKPTKKGIVHFQPFLHPLDSIKNWNSIYGKFGFLQYQFVIPFGKEELLSEFLNLMKTHRVASFLTVLKKLHQEEARFLSFPITGWTLAVDFSATEYGFIESLALFDKRLIECGGRVYLTKDSRLSRDDFEKMYPQAREWKAIKRTMDPECYWKSDQGLRLGLC